MVNIILFILFASINIQETIYQHNSKIVSVEKLKYGFELLLHTYFLVLTTFFFIIV